MTVFLWLLSLGVVLGVSESLALTLLMTSIKNMIICHYFNRYYKCIRNIRIEGYDEAINIMCVPTNPLLLSYFSMLLLAAPWTTPVKVEHNTDRKAH